MKRGSSGLSLIVGVDKPEGMSSHDVVNRCRRIFDERRVGHTGTLDPLATGVLPVCIGPATRLDQFMTAHDKRYRVRIGFGFETTTDDKMGDVTTSATVPAYLFDEGFARERVDMLVRQHIQVPPQYSAIKIDGRKAYEIARSGGSVELEPRVVEVYEAHLVDMREDEDGLSLQWTVDVSVSKGTYIRSLVRDLGREVMCPAHVTALERRSVGKIGLEHCVSLDVLENLKLDAALDPVRILGYRFAFGDKVEKFVNSGTKLYPDQVALYEPPPMQSNGYACPCTSSICESEMPPEDGEHASIVVNNRLKALYTYSSKTKAWQPACVFSTSVFR
ncbi:MAG: tRNA pseudouridine(55) synthase TruB, partial [Eggerthellaceae bacterium]|nr:tRNA pseudouridine(55) synthase TruB [Eggerthellaceae bacterium]